MKKILRSLTLGMAAFATISTCWAIDTKDDSGFAVMQMDSQYSSTTLQLKYTAETDGILTVVQNKSFDSALFTTPEGPATGDDFSVVIQPDGGIYKGEDPYTLTYTLDKGQTVYYIIPNKVTTGISQVTFSWQADAPAPGETIETAVIGTPFNCYSKGTNPIKYQFTPEISGVMSVLLSEFSVPICKYNNLVYTNTACTKKLELLNGEEYTGGKYLMTYYVNAGETYYFSQDASSTITCTVLEVLAKAPTLTMITSDLYPTPGSGSWIDSDNGDLTNFASGFRYEFKPANVQIASATVTYTNKEGETVTTNYSSSNPNQMEYMGGGWIVRLYQDLVNIVKNGMGNTYFTVSLNNITYNGERMDIELSDIDGAGGYIVVDNQTGSVTVKYKIPAQPMSLNQALSSWPETIYESWAKGDANGLATFVFSNPIEKIGEATVTLGTHTYGVVSGGDDPDPSAEVPYTINNNVLTLDFSKVTLSPGTKDYTKCTLFVLGVTDIDGQTMNEPCVDLKLNYEAGEAPDPIIAMEQGQIVSPEGNFYVLALDEFAVQWAGETLTPVEGKTMEATLYIDNVMKGQVPVEIVEGEYSDSEDTLSIDLSDYEGQYGAYMVTIPLGIVKNSEGNVNPTQIVSCNIFKENEEYVVDPAPGTLQTLDGYIQVIYANSAVVANPNAGAVLWAGNRIPCQTLEDSLLIPLFDVDAGEYELVVPATYLIIDNSSLNPEISGTYVVLTSGIDGLIDANEEGVYNVYNLNGVKVASGDANVVKSLNKGLYIINGKKVILK